MSARCGVRLPPTSRSPPREKSCPRDSRGGSVRAHGGDPRRNSFGNRSMDSAGFEPAASRLQSGRSTGLIYEPKRACESGPPHVNVLTRSPGAASAVSFRTSMSRNAASLRSRRWRKRSFRRASETFGFLRPWCLACPSALVVSRIREDFIASRGGSLGPPGPWMYHLGGDPSAGSPTDTLLRLNPACKAEVRKPHKGDPLTSTLLAWFDGRCVQGAGAYSPRDVDPRLLRVPPSRG